MVEPGTGEVKALAQSRPMGRNRKRRARPSSTTRCPKEYGDANGFQAGSTFKVFVLAAAIEQGIPLNTVYQRAGRACRSPRTSSTTCDGPALRLGTWSVRNYDFAAAPVNLYTGTRLSVNTFFAQLEQRDRALRALQAGQADGRPS